MRHMWQQNWGRQAVSGPGLGTMGQVTLVRRPEPVLMPVRGMHPNLGRPVGLGETAEGWMARAQKALQAYDALKARTAAIGNKTEREAIAAWLGNASVPGTPAYRYNTVKSDLEFDVPREGVGAYNLERRQNRIVELEELNRDFRARVENAEKVYGTVPAPQTIIRTVPGGPQAPAGSSNLTVPILAAGGAVALALVLTQL